MEKYQNIINVEYKKSNRRPHMSLNDRAAQFAPFAALNGYEESIGETGRLTEEKINLNNQKKEIISLKLNYINEFKLNELIKITYFIKDKQKTGGSYKTISTIIKRIDLNERVIYLPNDQKINIQTIININSDTLDVVFRDLDQIY